MRASYLFQLVNLLASAALLLLVLSGLSRADYLEWVLFSTIAGALIQLESSISVIVTRHIGRERARGEAYLAGGLVAAGRVYHRFALIGVTLMFAGGGLYLTAADNGRFPDRWPFEWATYCAAYLFYYYLGNYACSLIAMERQRSYAWIGIASRLTSVVLAAASLAAGWKVMGLCLAVLASFVIAAALYRFKVRQLMAPESPLTLEKPAAATPISFAQIGLHALYVFCAYGAYRAGLLIDAGAGSNTSQQASFGLALQIFALIYILSSVPLTMRVTPLVRAVATGESGTVMDEVARLSTLVNAVYLTAATAFVVGSGVIGTILPSRGAELPPMLELATLAAAFWLELNILVLINGLLAAQDFRFCPIYLASLALALGGGCLAWWLGAPFYLAFVACPAAVQACVALPLIFWLVERRFEFTLGAYVHAAGRHLWDVLRNPRMVLIGR